MEQQKVHHIESLPLHPPYVLSQNPNHNKENQFPDVIKRLLQARKKGSIRISYGRWKQLNMKNIIESLAELNCLNLELIQNNEPKILKQIEHLKLNKLCKIDLSDNGITTVQTLASIYFPHLQELKLQENKISDVRTLRKMNIASQNFHAICLANNPIKQINGIEEIASENLSLLNFCEFAWSERYIDIKPTVRIKSKLLKNMNVRTKYRIDKVEVLKKMVQRWPGSSIILPKGGRIRFEGPQQ